MNSEMVYRQKKLHLVLDLDHTLLHAVDIDILASKDREYLMKLASDGDLFKMAGELFLVKLRPYGELFLVKVRPYIRKFLKEASKMYDIYLCTTGIRSYAVMMAKLLDPKCEYHIRSRLITREDFKEKGKKSGDLVLGQEWGVVIVDDTEKVWKDHKEHLMLVGSYNYFKERRNKKNNILQKSFSERNTDENELNGALVNVLRVLKTVHGLFFKNPVCRDVRCFLGKIRRQILARCTLFFSRDVDDKEFEFPLLKWRAGELGAVCTDVYNLSVTQVVSVSSRPGTKGRRLAEKHNKFLVHPQWIYAAYYLWSRQAEKDYFPL
ncbi:RNA polymerase II C-terminal domain phosphatase-like 4 [Citrus sinensis]|nr:RNA polymerase II C-terminal domain phosphatase-like 4 [Citrus sinensis]